MAAGSPSKTRAVPSKYGVSMPATLTTEPLGASEPVSYAMPPRSWMGFRSACTTVPSGGGGARAARFSAIVLPVTVRQSPWRRPASSSSARTTGTPPMRSTSTMWNLPVGFRVGEVRHPLGNAVEVVELELHARLVGDGEQVQHGVRRAPRAMTTAMAFSKACLVMIWRGRIPHARGRSPRGPTRRRSRRGGGRRPAPRSCRKGHAEGFGDRGHRVGRETCPRTSLRSAGVVLDEGELLVAQGVDGVGPDRFEDTDDVEARSRRRPGRMLPP